MTTSGNAIQAGGKWPALRHPTSLGFNIPNGERNHFEGTPHWSDMLAMSQAAAGAGFEVLWFDDHFSFPSDDGLRGAWDVWTLMAALAASVPNVHLGPMVACTAYRNPGVIAKMTEMIDEISGGRFILGLGAGWQKDEYNQFGLRFEPRVSQFEEALEIINGLLQNGEVDVQGKYYQANNARNLPRGPRPEGAPILIGSTSDRMLKSLVKYADAWNTGGGTVEEIKVKIAKLDAACEAAGRDPQTVIRTVGVGFATDDYSGTASGLVKGADAQVARLSELRDLGFQHIQVRISPSTPEIIANLAPVVDAFNQGQ